MYIVRLLSLFMLFFCFTACAQQAATYKKTAVKAATEKKVTASKSSKKKTYAPPKKKQTTVASTKKTTKKTYAKGNKTSTHRSYTKKKAVASAKKKRSKAAKKTVQYAENTAPEVEDLEDLEEEELEEPEIAESTDIAITTITETKEATEQQKLLLDAAFSYLGTPYRYGGITRKGMDCSGFVSTAFKSIDIALSRSSQEMATQGKKVKLKNVKVGDLLFFKTLRNRKRISHVGMVVDVDGDEVKFIHASSKRGVVISSLSEAYYKKAFRLAKRVM